MIEIVKVSLPFGSDDASDPCSISRPDGSNLRQQIIAPYIFEAIRLRSEDPLLDDPDPRSDFYYAMWNKRGQVGWVLAGRADRIPSQTYPGADWRSVGL